VLHGHGQLARVFLGYFKDIASADRLIVAPEALNRYYLESGASGRTRDARIGATWMTREDRENEIADYVDWLDAVWKEVAAAASAVTVLGFSQGVATACRWIAAGHSRADRLIAWAGQLPPDVEATSFKRLQSLVFVSGTTDEYAAWIAEGDHQQRLAAVGITPQIESFEGGHRLDRLTLMRLAGVPASRAAPDEFGPRQAGQSRPLQRSIARRSFLPGLPLSRNTGGPIALSCAASASRALMLSSRSSYSVAATLAGPRCSDSPVTTTICSNGGLRMRTVAPAEMGRERLARCPSTSTRPASIASAARLRVLKNRAAQSQTSRRTGIS
jgi:predicted esterase